MQPNNMQPNTQFLILQKKYQINLAQTQFVQIDSLLTGSFHELPSNRRQPKITCMSRGQLNCLPKVEFRLQVEVGLGT